MTILSKLIRQLVEQVITETELPVKQKVSISIPEDIRELTQIFVSNGFKLYVVGGAVRDALLGKEPKDGVVVKKARPDQI